MELFQAIESHDIERAIELIYAGSNVNYETRGGDRPLHEACRYEPSLVELLITEGADIDAVTAGGYTPLHLACKWQPRVVESLIRFGANVNIQDREGNTPLHDACKWQPSVVELLIRNGADANLRNKEGLLPIHIVCESQQDENLIRVVYEATLGPIEPEIQSPILKKKSFAYMEDWYGENLAEE
jgi:ankyrin repeat protein